MNRYAGNHSVEKKEQGKFLTRFAALTESKNSLKELSEKDQFDKDYKKGRLAFASASKHMSLKSCGLDRFIEADTDAIWVREGDSIVRVDNDLDWVNKILEEEGN